MKSIFKNIYTIIVGFLILAVLFNVVPQPVEKDEGSVMNFTRILFGVVLFVAIVLVIMSWLR
jgi:uncharacterized membrane-anchored protein YitT (DUF2179 family)